MVMYMYVCCTCSYSKHNNECHLSVCIVPIIMSAMATWMYSSSDLPQLHFGPLQRVRPSSCVEGVPPHASVDVCPTDHEVQSIEV